MTRSRRRIGPGPVFLLALLCGACTSDDAARPETAAPGDTQSVSREELPGAADGAPEASHLLESLQAPGEAKPPDDGWPDVSDFLDKKYGFLPIAVPITEPAVGYGAAGGIMFISSPFGEAKAGFGRPNITFVGGLATDNGTRGLIVGDLRHWCDDRLQTTAGLIRSSVNLDFFGIGDNEVAKPLRYNLEPEGGMLRAKYRLGESSALWAGLGYAYASTKVSFEAPEETPGIPDFERTSHVGGLTPSLTWDTRDNFFTPTEGTYLEGSLGLFDQALGSDTEFQRAQLVAMQFLPLARDWFFGARLQASSVFGDEPFYLDPYVGLRGVPVMRYQGETAADLEAELRCQVWNRFSVLGFGGAGAAWRDFERLDDTKSVFSGGFGIRYELAREYGIHIGIDVAFSNGSSAIYLQIGSPWARP